VVSVYLPSGSSAKSDSRPSSASSTSFMPYLKSLKRRKRNYVALRRLEHCPQGNRHSRTALEPEELGFLPEERAWLDQLFGDERYVDGFREVE